MTPGDGSRARIAALTASLYVLMFAYGFSVTMIGPLIPIFMSAYHLSLSRSGLVPLFQGLGGLAAVCMGIVLIDRVRLSRFLMATFGIYSAATLFIAVAPPYIVLLILLFFVGGGTRLTEAILNASISNIHPSWRGFYLSLLHACFGAGALTGPLFSTVFISAKARWPYAFLTLGGFCVAVLIVYALVQRKIPVPAPASRPSGLNETAGLLRDKNLVRLFLMALCYVAFALSVSTWMPSYMTRQLQTGAVLASLPVSALWIGIICGRLVYSFLSLRYPAKSLLFFSTLAAGAVMTAAVTLNAPVPYLAALCAAGFLVGATMPLCIALGSSLQPGHSGAVSSLMTLAGVLGLLIFPWLIGVIADAAGFRYGVSAMALFPLAIAAFSAFLPGRLWKSSL